MNEQLSSRARSLGTWLGIHLEITLFGVKILDWRYPPENASGPVELEK